MKVSATPKVSVLMPVYNAGKYLKEAIESILAQTFKDFEFIIIDDGSSDNSVEIIKSLKDERIRFFQNEENLGISLTRNKLMDLAIGEYLALCDADDISVLTRFEKQVKFLDANPDVGAVSAWFEAFPEKKVFKHLAYPKCLDLLKGCYFAQPCAMLRNELFNKYNLRYKKEVACAEDYELFLRAIRYMEFANIQEVLLKYRWHGENISVSKNKIQQANAKMAQQNMLDFLTDDQELQEKLYEIIVLSQKKMTFLQRIFSLKRERGINFECKVLTILGIKVKLNVKRSQNGI